MLLIVTPYPSVMALSPQQHWRIAEAYESAAADYAVPPQHRKAFARRAELFRMLARLGAKQTFLGMPPEKQPAIESPNASDPGGLKILSKARHVFAWQQRR